MREALDACGHSFVKNSVMATDFRRVRKRFLARLPSPTALAALFDHIPDVYFFVKDRDGRFVLFNRAFLDLMGVRSEDEVLGKRDADFFPPSLWQNYTRDDRTVIETGAPVIDRIEPVRNPDGSIDWFNTTKIPVFDARGAIMGVAGFTRDIKKMNSTNARFLSMAPVIETIMSDYAQPLSVAALAAKVSLSVSQFERQFKKKFQTTPRKYITQIRINAACQLLTSTDLPISEIAQQTGFYDQSHFTHQFVRHRKLTPSRYRERYAARS